MKLAMTMPSSAARPARAIKPTHTAVLSSIPLNAIASMPPAHAIGIPEKTTSEMARFLKWR